ncbi:MAG: hypothetical protein LBV21_01070 [Candidatus Adiutrix sp.]|jgi:hypothetical protein|nr:hypothetical protein [Candidatus Adiutrix sp.]
MILGLNLHGLVRGAISAIHPEVPATLYQSQGQTTGPGGEIRPIYAPGRAVSTQMQSEGPSVLAQVDRVGQEEVSRKFYLFSDPEPGQRVAGIVRPLSRNGDMLHLAEAAEEPGQICPHASGWWLVEATIEDFSRSGWVSVRATLQVKPPDFSGSDWWTP